MKNRIFIEQNSKSMTDPAGKAITIYVELETICIVLNAWNISTLMELIKSCNSKKYIV